MITICIDEYGEFENNDGKIKFIGGLIYKGDSYEDEKNKIENSLKGLCVALTNKIKNEYNLDYEFIYPLSIHLGRIQILNSLTNKVKLIDKNLIAFVKNEVQKWFTSYINNNSDYELTFLVNNPYFKNEKIKFVQSNITNIENASNLYERMVSRLIYNNVLYNTNHLEVVDFNLDIARRVAVVNKNDAKYNDYIELGYEYKNNSKDTVRFFITNQNTFKTAISTKLYENNISRNLKINLNVKSIFYDNNSMEATTPFLYLADFACDLINTYLEPEKEDLGILNIINIKNREIKNITPFVYDDVDFLWSEAIEFYNRRSYIECLAKIYDIENNNSAFVSLYKDKWIKSFEIKINEIFEADKINMYISEIEYYMSKSSYDYKKGLYLAQKLWDVVENNEKLKNDQKYKISDILLRAYNHLGDLKANDFYKICVELKNYVSIDDYINTVIRSVEIDANIFDFDSGIEKLKYVLECTDILKGSYEAIAQLNEIYNTNSYKITSRGKILSSLGQFYAFKGEYEKSKEYFLKACDEFLCDEKNKMITYSYFLHLLIEMKDKKLYEEHAKVYFNSGDLKNQYELIINDTKKNGFKLYIYIKAIKEFYIDTIDQKYLIKIIHNDYNLLGFATDTHPFELIYKNIAFILLKMSENNSSRTYIKKSIECVKDKGMTIELINYFNYISYLNEIDDNKVNAEMQKAIFNLKNSIEKEALLSKSFEKLFEYDNSNNINSIVSYLKSKFKYMYS